MNTQLLNITFKASLQAINKSIKRSPLKSRLSLFLLFCLMNTACVRTITERDIFSPEDAPNTTISITIEDREIFTDNKANPTIWADYGAQLSNNTIDSPIGKISYKLARNQKLTTNNETPPLIIHCGGNSFDVPNHGDLAIWKILPHGDALVWDYPGYGLSEGEASVDNIRIATKSFAENISQIQRDPSQDIILWGYSLGGFVCPQLAVDLKEVKALIFENAAPSAIAAKPFLLPWFAKPFLRTRLSPILESFNTIEVLQNQKLYILILAARKDRVLPITLSELLRDQLSASGHYITYHEFPNANHFSIGIDENLEKTVSGFLKSLTVQ